jgi:hypothetical protein
MLQQGQVETVDFQSRVPDLWNHGIDAHYVFVLMSLDASNQIKKWKYW